MKATFVSKRVATSAIAGTLLAAFSLLAQGPAQSASQEKAQAKTGNIGLYRNQQLAPDGPAPKLADGTPDLSGVWLGGGSNSTDISNPRSLKPGDQVVMLPLE